MTAIATVVEATVARMRLALSDQAPARGLSRWALHPLALVDDGKVRIVDLETRQPRVWDPYPYQREILEAWIDINHLERTGHLVFRDVICEKSRQVGLTWALSYGAWWAVVFHTTQGLVKARKASEVDDGGDRSTWRSFLGKIRYIDRHIAWPPGEQRPRLRFAGGHQPTVVNLDRPGSWILGEGETSDPGRGGTFSWAVVDELAFVPWGEQVHQALGAACPRGRAYVSTANGRANVHHRLVASPPVGWRLLRVHWSQHPLYGAGAHVAGELDDCHLCQGTRAGIPYDPRSPRSHRYPGRLTSPWYETRIADMTDEQVAQELEIDYTASVAARVYQEAQREIHLAPQPIPYLPTGPSGLDVGIDYGLDCTAIVVCQPTPSEYRVLGYLKLRDHTPDQAVVALRRLLVDLGVPAEHTEPRWTREMFAVGDPSGEGRDLASGRSVASEYRRLGLSVQSRTVSVAASIGTVKRLLRGQPVPLRISPGHGGEQLMADLEANRWPTDRTGARRPGASRPLDDDSNHGCRALAYLVSARFGVGVSDSLAVPERDVVGARPGVLDPGIGYDMAL